MLEQVIFLLFVNPAFPESTKMYGSGLGAGEHNYESDKPAADYPLLTLDMTAQDFNFNLVRPGIYAVVLSSDSKFLRLYQGSTLIADAPVVQVLELDDELSVAEAKIVQIKNNQIVIVYKNEKLEVHGILYKYSPY